MLAPVERDGREHLEQTKLRLMMNANGTPSISREYAKDTSTFVKPAYDKFFDWASSVVSGFFMTWGSKAMRSPIPTGRYISSLIADPGGYQLASTSGPAVITLFLSKGYLITRILTTAPGQTIDEHPEYTSPPQILLKRVDATNRTTEGATHVAYEMDYLSTNTIFFPSKVHLVVDNNIDMKFALENCSVERNQVITVGPPQ
jgi:hypothetical protein